MTSGGTGSNEGFTSAVNLACHDLRTPLATISGFAKTLIRAGELPEREGRFLGMIDEAAMQLAGLVDQLSLAGRIESGRYTPNLSDVDTFELAASSDDERVSVSGIGVLLETDAQVIRDALAALALAALRHGEVETIGWHVSGRELTLSPVLPGAAPVVDGTSPLDLGALVARMAIERLGGSLQVNGEKALVRL
jgi:signal transduction histidine kinase